MDQRHLEMVALINDNLDIVDFGEFGQGSSDLSITKAQERLDIVFPPSYVWWLKNYGGGEILGDEVFSVYSSAPYEIPSGDIVYINELDRKSGFTSNAELVLQINDQAEIFYFDLSEPKENGEYPVFRNTRGFKRLYAEDFLDFLTKRITDEF